MRREWRYLSLALVLLIAACCIAQDDDDDDSIPQENDGDNPASLSLNFDRQGGARVTFNLPIGTSDFDALPAILAQTFHCPAGSLTPPNSAPFDASFEKDWSAAKRERYAKQVEQYNRHMLTGNCDAALSRTGMLFSADFDYTALLVELKRIGVDQLGITLNVPQTQFFDYSRTNVMRVPSMTPTYVIYFVPLKDVPPQAILHLAYGLRPRDVQRALALLAAFLLAPVLLTLWMRRRALALAKTDPPAAWFGFVRGLNWVVLGSMLVWMSSGLGARKTLEEWIFQQKFSALVMAATDVALMLVPYFLIYLICVFLSYRVHAQLRNTQWTRAEFFAQQLATVGAQLLPLMLLVSAIGVMKQQPILAASLSVATLLSFQILTNVKLRLMKSFPQPLTTGDLRDRIFNLARQLGVDVAQIFILPAAKGQVANAFAARNRIVMFTDYLLEHLNKKEVDGVAAHELAHLRYKHPAKIGLTLIAVLFLPRYFSWLSRTVMSLLMSSLSFISDARLRGTLMVHMWQGLTRFEQWPERDLVLLTVGMAGFYFLSRHFENVADATAVRLTGNAEAQITGILKVTRLNLMPIRWGKATGSWVTHPSTYHRIHRMAKAGGLSEERLQEIIRQYDTEGAAAKVVPPEDRYSVHVSDDPEQIRVALDDRLRLQWKLWALLSVYVLPPALFAVVIPKFHLSIMAGFLAHLGGIAITAFLVTFAGAWLGESGYGRLKQRVLQCFQHEKVPVGQIRDRFVGFAPGPFPRLFGAHHYWDPGFLVFSKDGLQFIGEQVKFAFSPSEIEGVAIGRGSPSWWKFERVYIRWKTPDGKNGIFNLSSLEPGSIWKSRDRARHLYREILHWRQQPALFPATRPEFVGVKKLELGQVTSMEPRKLGSFKVYARIFLYWIPLIAVVSLITPAHFEDLFFTVLILRVIHSIPYWRYRDRVPDFPAVVSPVVPQMQGATVGR